jgi:hypothetical protein
MSMPIPASLPSPPRPTRPLPARKRPNDALWFSNNTATVTSAKRQAAERIESEPRNKRKRVEPTVQATSQLGLRTDKPQERQNDEPPAVRVVTFCHQFIPKYQTSLLPTRADILCLMLTDIMILIDGFFNVASRRLTPVSRAIRSHTGSASITAKCA